MHSESKDVLRKPRDSFKAFKAPMCALRHGYWELRGVRLHRKSDRFLSPCSFAPGPHHHPLRRRHHPSCSSFHFFRVVTCRVGHSLNSQVMLPSPSNVLGLVLGLSVRSTLPRPGDQWPLKCQPGKLYITLDDYSILYYILACCIMFLYSKGLTLRCGSC